MTYGKSIRIHLFQWLFETYTRLGLSYNTESLLWQRSTHEQDGKWKRITYPEARNVPSWSWMAYDGEISYMKVPFSEVDWSNAVQYPYDREAEEFVGPDHARNIGLKAVVREFSSCAQELSFNTQDRGQLIFDEDERTINQELKCAVLGMIRQSESSDEQKHLILVLEHEIGVESTYKRVGIGLVQRRDIFFDSAGEQGWIV
ncbi:serine threonine kinase protein [Rutstroemia sp. NJR-2017a WRK4]|nr:serine threonine kinase protein [Rutstroemia sp. NJR-2017a WRK4]